MVASKTTISPDLGKPDSAVPVKTECGEPAAFTPGPDSYRTAGPNPTTDGMAYLIADILGPEPWAAAHNRELWKNDASGWSFDV